MQAPAREALSCFGDIFRLQQNLAEGQVLEQARGAALVLVQAAVFGVGSEITHPFLASE